MDDLALIHIAVEILDHVHEAIYSKLLQKKIEQTIKYFINYIPLTL